LASRSSRRRTAQALALRARIVLACAEAAGNQAVAGQLVVCRDTVGTSRRRYLTQRLDGLPDEPRSGASRRIDDARIEAVVTRTLDRLPADATRRSSRGVARASRLSVSTVQRIWRAFGLQPHRLEAFKLSTDPDFVDPDFVAKVRDVVGLCMAPPERALVRCVHETSQIQALDRSQQMPPPPRPACPAQPRLHPTWHDQPLRGLRRRHRAGDRQVLPPPPRRRVPPRPRRDRGSRTEGLDMRRVMDNDATRRTKLIRDRLANAPRRHVH
jgi:transposase